MNKATNFIVEVPKRLDVFLSQMLNETRNQIAHLIKAEAICVDGKVVTKPGLKLKENQEITINYPEIKQEAAQEIDFDVEILYEDDDVLVINKPSGLTVHPAPSVKEPTLVDWLKHKGISLSTISGEERHGIVHRIDKETTGALIVAKNNEAHVSLSEQLQDKSLGRYYLALIDLPLKENNNVEAPIARNPQNRLKMAVVAGGKEAKTAFEKLSLSHDEKTELIACKLFTGRTHQIRVHLHSLSRHILGDNLYGFKSKKTTIPRVFLHAYLLYFIHPKTQEQIFVKAPLHDDMNNYLKKHFDMEHVHEKIDSDKFSLYFSTNH